METGTKRKIFLTGSNGQLGRALNEEYASEAAAELINTDVPDLDITNLEEVLKQVQKIKPDVIINCAAMTAVDLCESRYEDAYRANAVGPRNLSIAAAQVGAKLFQISTDYVFSGDTDRPYIEDDRPDPQSVYGRTKYVGEQMVREFAEKYFIIRTAWLYGEGKNFVRTMLKLAETNETVRVVGDQFGTPTSAKDVAKMIHYLEPTQNYGVFHGTCEGYCSWADFAVEIFRQAGLPTKVEYITTGEYGAAAKRPANAVLDNQMLRMTGDFRMPEWKDALAVYLGRPADGSGNA